MLRRKFSVSTRFQSRVSSARKTLRQAAEFRDGINFAVSDKHFYTGLSADMVGVSSHKTKGSLPKRLKESNDYLLQEAKKRKVGKIGLLRAISHPIAYSRVIRLKTKRVLKKVSKK